MTRVVDLAQDEERVGRWSTSSLWLAAAGASAVVILVGLTYNVRAAKEQLSRASSAAVHVPLFESDTHVTREEFEALARPWLDRTVFLTGQVISQTGLRPDQIAGLFLVGGSSRIPLAGTLLHRRFGVAPTLIAQPELVVAMGATAALVGVKARLFAE